MTGLARAAGLGGMVGGQMLDLAAEGRFGKNDTPQGEKDVLTLQAMKTGAILKFCCVAGAILGNAPQAKRDAVGRYGQVIGQAFQIADDLLDVEGDTATSARPPARTPPTARRHWSICSASPARGRGWRNSSTTPRAR